MGKKLIKRGSQYYIKFGDILIWKKISKNEMIKGDHYLYDECTYESFDFMEHQNTLIKVKYLGDGIFKEVLTGEKIQLRNVGYNRLDICDGNKFYDKFHSIAQSIVLNFNTYLLLSKIDREEGNSIYSYMAALDSFKENISNYSLVYHDAGNPVCITAETNKQYAKVTDDVRRVLIQLLKQESLKNKVVIFESIKDTIEKYSKATPELIEQAYAENEAFNLTLKSKEQKDS